MLVFAFTACGSGGGEKAASNSSSSSGSTIANITLTPVVPSIQVGQTQQFVATAKDAKGNTIPGATFMWISSNPSLASISNSGLATGHLAGSSSITATSAGVNSNPSTLTIIPSTITSITLSPLDATIQAGQTQQFVATAKDANGDPVLGATITWIVSNPAAATVNSSGMATGLLTGNTTMTATTGMVSSNPVTLTVTPSTISSIILTPSAQSIQVGQTQQFVATAKDAGDNPIPNVVFTWLVSDQTIASMIDTGLATGLLTGSTTITATSGTVNSNSSTLTVTPAAISSITLSPPVASILAGQAQQFVATAKDASGTSIPKVTFTWASSDSSVASIDETGTATAGLSSGTTMVTASAEGVTSSGAQLHVTTGSRVYTTTFPLFENPISEGGNWLNGQVDGVDWQNARTTPGLAFGTQSGSGGYDDTVALLAGTWGPDQTIEATVYTVNQSDSNFEEVELRLRSSLSPHQCTGYEVLFSVNGYIQIVRWNGPLGDFTVLDTSPGIKILSTGDVVKATIVGDTITAYVNDVQALQVMDSTYTDGSPGMGFFLQGAAGVNADYGFTSFTASD